MREAAEEAGIPASALTIRAEVVTKSIGDQAIWTYTTVVADAVELLTTAANHESTELRWVPEPQIDGLKLHPGFAAAWPLLRCQTVLAAPGARTVELDSGRFAWQVP